MNKILLALIAVVSVGFAVAAQTVDRKPIKPIRPFVVMTGQSITDLQQKLHILLLLRISLPPSKQ